MTRTDDHVTNALTSLFAQSPRSTAPGNGQTPPRIASAALSPPTGQRQNASAPSDPDGTIDPQRLELYYKTIDYLTAQAAAADNKALAVLTIEAGLVAALAVVVPLVAPHFPTLHGSRVLPPALTSILSIAWIVFALAAIWLVVAFCLCAFGVWMSMASVLAWDAIDPPPFRKRRLLTVLRSGELTPLLRQDRRSASPRPTPTAALPFDATALTEATGTVGMASLDIAVALLAHIQAAATVAEGKARALRSGLLSFLSQVVWLGLLSACWYVLLVLAH